MCAVVDFDQTLGRYRGVFFGRCQASVAEQFLDLAQIRAHVKKVGRVTMPQPVGMDAICDPYPLRALFQNPADVPNTQANELTVPQTQ
jgi:hypothetical protein